MPHVICQPCHDCKYTDCVVPCPVECFYQDEAMLYIHPQDCINCEACVIECPVQAIFADRDVPGPWKPFIQLNADRATALKAGKQGHIHQPQGPRKGPACGQGTPPPGLTPSGPGSEG
jgi:ferredoxin